MQRAPRQLRTPRRLLEVLPVELLRDAGAGSSPVHCDFAIGGTKTSCELGGEVATLRRTASGKLWPGSVLIELAPEDGAGGGTPEADLTVDVRFDGAEGTVAVGSTTLSLHFAERGSLVISNDCGRTMGLRSHCDLRGHPLQ